MSGVIEDVVTMLSDPLPADKKEDAPANDPTEYLPVMRHHLHEALWSIHMAFSNLQAMDLADSYRQGQTVPTESPLARQLERSHATLSAYLGLLDNDAEGEDDVSEDE